MRRNLIETAMGAFVLAAAAIVANHHHTLMKHARAKMFWHATHPSATLGGPKYDPTRAPRSTPHQTTTPTASANVARSADPANSFAALGSRRNADTDNDSDDASVDTQAANIEEAADAASRTLLAG